jgi:hypothetical protein
MNGKTTLTGIALVVAIAIIVVWLGGLWAAYYYHLGDQETQWSRMLVLLKSVEVVAIAAAGALLGTTVQMPRVADANKRAEKAEEAAKKGRELATTVKVEAKKTAGTDMSESLARAEEVLAL